MAYLKSYFVQKASPTVYRVPHKNGVIAVIREPWASFGELSLDYTEAVEACQRAVSEGNSARIIDPRGVVLEEFRVVYSEEFIRELRGEA